MFSYQTYKMVHYFGLILLFFGIGGVLIPSISGFSIQGKPRVVAFVTHGIGMLFLLIGGFGMLARLQLDGIPPWIHVKLAVWLIMGLAIGLAKRMPSWLVMVAIIAIAMIAPYMAIYKPI
ncbi:MAG: hypothetical protein RJB66_2097 [Pseudomonadota bacterium]|jgi:hypothetical protein